MRVSLAFSPSPTSKETVVSNAVLWPLALKTAEIMVEVVVLPSVPVTAITFIFLAGKPFTVWATPASR